MYVTYDYYKNEYQGSITDENEFNKYVREATFEINRYTLKEKEIVKMLKKDDRNADTIRYTMCKLIDNIKQSEVLLNNALQSDLIQAQGISSESVKDHNVKFTTSKELNSSKIKSDTETNNIIVMNKYLTRLGLLYRGLC